MVWGQVVWDSRAPLSNNPFHKGIPEFQTILMDSKVGRNYWPSKWIMSPYLICARVDQLLICGMVIPPLIGNPFIVGIKTLTTIGLMIIPYYMEIMGVLTQAHMTKCAVGFDPFSTNLGWHFPRMLPWNMKLYRDPTINSCFLVSHKRW